jgi:sigma-E factor negative regulatory protein RseA
MSEQIREQVSAFLDGELPNSETELLLKRLTRDAELRESFGRYALIGESLRGATHAGLSRGFAMRVNRAIDGEHGVVSPHAAHHHNPRWWPFAGVAVAAGVAVVAVVALQQREVATTARSGIPMTAQTMAAPKSQEALSYTVPAAAQDGRTAMPAARLTNYVFAHSKYSSVLGQSNVLSGLLADADEQQIGSAGRDGSEAAPQSEAAGPQAPRAPHVAP